MKRKNAQHYSAEEFDAVVALVTRDPQMRADIERITGKQLTGKSPREIFDLFRAVENTIKVQATVVAFGRGKVALAETARELNGVAGVLGEVKKKNEEITVLKKELAELRNKQRSMEHYHRQELRAAENRIAAPAIAIHSEGTGQ